MRCMSQRPTTVSEMLAIAADLLDASQRSIEALETLSGKKAPISSGTQVQEDLRTLSAQLSKHRALDAEVHALLHAYDPAFGDNRMCSCGHPYHRHFDSYDEMAPVGCKYCPCGIFDESPLPT